MADHAVELGRSGRPPQGADGSEAVQGAGAVVPLWAGAVPFGVVFAVGARAAEVNVLETLALSILAFAGSALPPVVILTAASTPEGPIVLATLILNLQTPARPVRFVAGPAVAGAVAGAAGGGRLLLDR